MDNQPLTKLTIMAACIEKPVSNISDITILNNSDEH